MTPVAMESKNTSTDAPMTHPTLSFTLFAGLLVSIVGDFVKSAFACTICGLSYERNSIKHLRVLIYRMVLIGFGTVTVLALLCYSFLTLLGCARPIGRARQIILLVWGAHGVFSVITQTGALLA